MKHHPEVKHIIAVASGKGGVGKSTVAVNLAVTMARMGYNVGLLDADIYGPSQPTMLGAIKNSEIKDKKVLKPIMCHGIQSISIGYLIDETSPMVWRGPMVSMALQQLFNDTQWEQVEYLIIDLPPGTGDIQLTLAQKIPVQGAVIVTTPQDLALADVRRAYEMFCKVNIPVLGIVENMSTHICNNCGAEEKIFGEGGAASLAEQYGIEVLGALPLDIAIREQTDKGQPPAMLDGPVFEMFKQVARTVIKKIVSQPKDYTRKFPNIVVETS